MRYNKIKDNRLIKRKVLRQILKQGGIKRISVEAIDFIEKKAKEDLSRFSINLLQHLKIRGKKTLEKLDIEEITCEKTKEYLQT